MASESGNLALTWESEMIKNQTFASALGPATKFDVIQTQSGDSVYFHIDSKGALHAVKENSGITATGWTDMDISSQLAVNHGSATFTVKTFALTQHPESMNFDLFLIAQVAATIQGTAEDHLYVCMDHENTTAAWKNPCSWVHLPFDATIDGDLNSAPITKPAPFVIVDLDAMYIPNTVANLGAITNVVVDILRQDTTDLVDRYYLGIGLTPVWVSQPLPVDFTVGSVKSYIGNRQIDAGYPGTYVFGNNVDQPLLLYVPQSPDSQPSVSTVIDIPGNAVLESICPSVITDDNTTTASQPTNVGFTSLFAAASGTNGGLYYYPPPAASQFKSTPIQIFPSTSSVDGKMFDKVTKMKSLVVNGVMSVWLLNAHQQLFYLSCPIGSEHNTAAWSFPVPISNTALDFAFYINKLTKENKLFIHARDEGDNASLVQMTQHAVRGWVPRPVLLPTTDTSIYHETITWTTHVKIIDQSSGCPPSQVTQDTKGNQVVTGIDVLVASTTAANISINNIAYRIGPSESVTVTTDLTTGSLVVMEMTTTLVAVTFTVQPPGSAATTINPSLAANTKMSKIGSASDLTNVKLPNGQPLVPSSSPDVNNIGNSMGKVNQLGLLASSSSSTSAANVREHVTSLTKNAEGFGSWFSDAVDVVASDLYHWVKNVVQAAVDDIKQYTVAFINDAWHFVVELSTGAFKAVIKCAEDVGHVFLILFNKIKLGIEDLIAWLGFLFEWKDILRTHRVLSSMFTNFIHHCIDELDKVESSLTTLVDHTKVVQNQSINMNNTSSNAFSTIATQGQTDSHINKPQCQWGVTHMHHHMHSATTQYSGPVPTNNVDNVLNTLKSAVDKQSTAFVTMGRSIETTWNKRDNQALGTTISEVMGALVTLLESSGTNVLTTFIGIGTELLTDILQLLTAEIDIPIITPIYHLITEGSQLTILDLMCLVGAIPATLIAKIVAGSAPFPDNESTSSIINANGWTAFCSALTSSSSIASLPQSRDPGAFSTAAAMLQGACDVVGWAGTLVVMRINAAKFLISVADPDTPPLTSTMRYICIVANMAYITPGIPQIVPFLVPGQWAWYNDLSDGCLILCQLKSVLDNCSYMNDSTNEVVQYYGDYVSPVLDTLLNTAWFVSLVAQGVITWGDDWTNATRSIFIGNVAFDVGGMISVCAAPKITSVEVATGFALLQLLANGLYSVCCGTAGIYCFGEGKT